MSGAITLERAKEIIRDHSVAQCLISGNRQAAPDD
jgi:hypothetical protein